MIKEGAAVDRETEEEHMLTIIAQDDGGRIQNEQVSRPRRIKVFPLDQVFILVGSFSDISESDAS